jgi:hypothetical protein
LALALATIASPGLEGSKSRNGLFVWSIQGRVSRRIPLGVFGGNIGMKARDNLSGLAANLQFYSISASDSQCHSDN